MSNPRVAELRKVLDFFDLAYRQRTSANLLWQSMLTELSPLELLIYTSL